MPHLSFFRSLSFFLFTECISLHGFPFLGPAAVHGPPICFALSPPPALAPPSLLLLLAISLPCYLPFSAPLPTQTPNSKPSSSILAPSWKTPTPFRTAESAKQYSSFVGRRPPFRFPFLEGRGIYVYAVNTVR